MSPVTDDAIRTVVESPNATLSSCTCMEGSSSMEARTSTNQTSC